MKTNEELEIEYKQFCAKVAKASKDFVDAYNELSVQNQQRFKQNMKNVLPVALIDLYRKLNS